jgi:LmbE family N-acetylglucosaminyl deacetylase
MEDTIERVMVVVAHPDDAEFGAAGTVAKLVKEGCRAAYVLVTRGDKGSDDRAMTPDRLARIREEEQRDAARTLGVESVQFLGYPDCEVEDTRDLRRDITREIRRFRPDVVITQNPRRTDFLAGSHRDHRITGGAVIDSIYPLARDHMAFPELLPEFEPHKVREIWVMQWDQPQLVIDISETMERKLEALACHRSQVADFPRVEARVRERARMLGRGRDYAYAETFDRIVIGR